MYILYGFMILFLAGLMVLAPLMISAHQARSEKEKLAAAKLRTQELRAERLQRDLDVVANRAILVSNQSVMVELRIEEKRKELGYDSTPFNPNP